MKLQKVIFCMAAALLLSACAKKQEVKQEVGSFARITERQLPPVAVGDPYLFTIEFKYNRRPNEVAGEYALPKHVATGLPPGICSNTPEVDCSRSVAGLVIADDGIGRIQLQGTPTEDGLYDISIDLDDGFGAAAQFQYSLRIMRAPQQKRK